MTDTLKSICDQCTHLQNPRLDFVPSDLERERGILTRDLRELVSAAAAESEKTVAVLAGSILEGVLYSFIKSQSAYIEGRRGTFEFNPDHSLQNYVSIYNRWLSHLTPNVALPDSVVYYRDLVHMNREISSPPGSCAAASRDMLRILDSLLGALAELAPTST